MGPLQARGRERRGQGLADLGGPRRADGRPHPVLVPSAAPVAVRRAARAPGFGTEPFMRRRRHLPRASGGGISRPIRGGSLSPQHGLSGPSPRSAASPHPGPRGHGRPEARRRPSRRPAPHPVLVPFRLCRLRCRRCRKGAGVLHEPYMRRRRHLSRPIRGGSLSPQHGLSGPSPRSAASPHPGPRGHGRPEARRRPSRRPAPHPVLVPFRLCRLRCRRCRKGAGVLHEPYMRRRRHLPRACGGASAAPSRRPARTHGQARRRTGFLAGRRDRDAA